MSFLSLSLILLKPFLWLKRPKYLSSLQRMEPSMLRRLTWSRPWAFTWSRLISLHIDLLQFRNRMWDSLVTAGEQRLDFCQKVACLCFAWHRSCHLKFLFLIRDLDRNLLPRWPVLPYLVLGFRVLLVFGMFPPSHLVEPGLVRIFKRDWFYVGIQKVVSTLFGVWLRIALNGCRVISNSLFYWSKLRN